MGKEIETKHKDVEIDFCIKCLKLLEKSCVKDR